MKYLIFLVIYLDFARTDYNLKLNDQQIAVATKYGTRCRQIANITWKQIFDLRDGRFTHVTHRMKCFTQCVMRFYGFFKDSQLKPDVVLAKLGPIAGVDEVKAAQAECDWIKGRSDCDTAFKIYECYHRHDTYKRAEKIIKDLNLPVVTNDKKNIV